MASILMHSFGWATERRQAAKVRASDSAERDFWSMIACGPWPANRVTASTPGSSPRATDSGARGEPSSSSAKHQPSLPGLPMRGAVDAAGDAAADVAHDELQGSADGGVGPVALAEHVDAGVHPDAVPDGAVDDDDRARRRTWWPAGRAC